MPGILSNDFLAYKIRISGKLVGQDNHILPKLKIDSFITYSVISLGTFYILSSVYYLK